MTPDLTITCNGHRYHIHIKPNRPTRTMRRHPSWNPRDIRWLWN